MDGKNIVLGVSGGIAAYKACELLRRLKAAGHDVTVVATESALKFVGIATFEALSGNPVSTDVFTDVPTVRHVAIGQQADLVIVAPATADLLARTASGRGDDLLAATLLVSRAPVLMAPAMHTEMWTHPATVANVATLRSRGVTVVPPAVGRLTGPDSGPGRLPDPEHLAQLAELLLAADPAHHPLPFDLAGRRVVVSAGGTREALDPVRFLGNRSSGRQGYAIALVAAARGAEVTLVAANAALADPPGVVVRPVVSAVELQTAMREAVASGTDAVVMNAAVADFRPADPAAHKIKKTADTGPPAIELLENPDILAGLVADRGADRRPVIAGFAAETGDDTTSPLEFGRQKLARKGCDLLVVNRVDGGRGFETDHNAAVILRTGGDSVDVPFGPKTVVAAAVCDALAAALAQPGDPVATNLSTPTADSTDLNTRGATT
ncbi:bifunctional phosphopantothenoylcysteine decarboxylase/phosphopantothenate--cysteine ligase CoaBC [Nakamurella lactea]|uniref:bifunctional phosphopantothenoylcysteine decarboxylase/phosphopantothenate--cysteine ligase CoaBC n=1 Tax=Nakamurella lactea TaxID=459515 RepID=UPI000A045559